MGMRRDARKHDTTAIRRQAVVSEDYAEHRQGDRVITIDGPGRVVAVHDGPHPGSEEYEIRLEGGLGGGTYDAGQITASAPVEASVGTSEATGQHLASDDYPELGTLLHDRPDPASLHYTAALEYQDGPDGGLSLTPAAPIVEDDEGQVMRDMSQYHSNPAGDFSLASRHTAMPSRKHPAPEGFEARIDRLSHGRHVLEGSLHGAPVGWLSYFAYGSGGDPLRDDEPGESAHSVRVQNLEVPGEHHRGQGVASAMMDHLYANHPDAEIDHGDRTEAGHGWWNSYEDPDPGRNVTARSINGEEIDEHGSAPGWHRAANPNVYDRISTEGEPDPQWIEDARERQKAMASSLPSLTAHKVVGPNPEDPGEIAKHLIEHHGYTHDQLHNLGDSGQGDELAAEHELEHNASTYDEGVGGGDFGAGEQGGGIEHKHGPRYDDFPGIPHIEHPIWGGAHNPEPGAAEQAVRESVPAGVHEDDIPRHPSALSMLATAAVSPSFRFHVTAAWRDVQAKAKRIRAKGGVQITHADEGTVFGNVRGDHNVYETGLQRVVGKRQSVATYTCGCKWGAYHWGANDDLSRFAGRMCSHALALQYEAASRGMFGRDVQADDAKPRWVPSKVVVKYDIDSGQHIRSTASVPEQPPILVAMALLRDDDLAARVITAAVNDMFGDTAGYTEPSLMDPAGPTVPWNKDENPTSAGPLSGGEPHNWGSITGPQMLPRIASAMSTEAFWQAIVPLVRAVAPKVIKSVAPKVIEHEVKEHQPGPVQEAEVPDGTEHGSQALLHDEPEGALPETDGDDHTASLGDVDIAESHSVWELPDDALSPENPSIQTQGGTADIVAEFQRSAAAKSLMDGGPAGKSSSDIAQAAQAHLAKTAGTSFSRAEQDALIHESPGVQASNTDRLDIEGTHYAELEQMDGGEDDALWLM